METFSAKSAIDVIMFKVISVLLVICCAVGQGFNIQPKITNGKVANAADIPFFVAIRDDDGPLCSASLLSDS